MRYVHTNIAARDWKSLSEFYIEVFDCKVKPPQRNLSGAWLDQAAGLNKAELEGVHLLLPGFDENGPTLEVFTYKEMHENSPIMANHLGFTHIAFEVDDVALTLEAALKKGASLLGQVAEKNVEGVGLLKFVYFRDPEGNIIEIQSWERPSLDINMAVEFNEIDEAFDFVSFGQMDEHQAFLDKESGKIYWYSEYGDNEEELPEDLDNEKYIEIPHKNELGLGKDLVLDFAYEYLPNEAEEVELIFRRKGAYSKFKTLLERKGVLDKWYEYESEAQEKALREWCDENEIQIKG